jgi:hypothetical protein
MTNLDSDVQGRGSIEVSLVDVGTEVFYQASHNIQPAMLSSDVQGRGSTVLSLADVGTKLIHKALYNIQSAFLRSDEQGRGSIEVDVSTKLIYQASQHLQSAVCRSDEQGRGSIWIFVVDVSAEIHRQASQHVEVLTFNSNKQGICVRHAHALAPPPPQLDQVSRHAVMMSAWDTAAAATLAEELGPPRALLFLLPIWTKKGIKH